MTLSETAAGAEDAAEGRDQFIPVRKADILRALIGHDHVVPADTERGINRIEHGVKALRQSTLLGDFERNTAAANFYFRARQTLPHRFRCDEKGLGNAQRIEAQYRLQHEGCVHGWVDRRVRSHKEQF